MNKKIFLCFSIFTLFFIGLFGKDKKPNILIILADDLGWGDLSCYGAKDIMTPKIDNLFSQGLKFDRFYSTSSVCSPARASLMSGLYSRNAGMSGMIRTKSNETWGKLREDISLLPEILRDNGYYTMLVGKWNLGLSGKDLPNARGFDDFYGFLGDMMEDYYTHLRYHTNYMRVNDKEIKVAGHATDVFTEWACHLIEVAKGKKKPFFMYLAYNAPHDPLQSRPDYLERIQQREANISPTRAKYAGLVEHLDDSVGKVIDKLKKENLFDDTIIVFLSDNGGSLSSEANNGHFRDGKATMYDGGLAVSMGITYPNKIPANTQTDFEAMTCDIMPTLLDIVGVNIPENLDGVSFKELLLDGKQLPIQKLRRFCRLDNDRWREAIRLGEFKLVLDNSLNPPELYNTHSDPSESTNLANEEKDIFNNMSLYLQGRP